jgi:hypothetical protein
LHDFRVCNPLERAQVILGARWTTADEQDWYAFQVRVGNGGHAIGHTWPGGGEHDTELARKNRVGVRHMDGGTLVTHIDDAHTTLGELIPDQLDMAALQTEHPIHTSGNEKVDDQLRNRASG